MGMDMDLLIVLIMGLGYALVASSLWPLLSYNIPKRLAGTSYGIMQSMQLAGLLIMFTASGWLLDRQNDIEGGSTRAGYMSIEYCYMTLDAIAIACCIVLFMSTDIHGNAKSAVNDDE